MLHICDSAPLCLEGASVLRTHLKLLTVEYTNKLELGITALATMLSWAALSLMFLRFLSWRHWRNDYGNGSHFFTQIELFDITVQLYRYLIIRPCITRVAGGVEKFHIPSSFQVMLYEGKDNMRCVVLVPLTNYLVT